MPDEVARCLFVGPEPTRDRFLAPSMEGSGPIGKPRVGGLWTCREVPGEPSAWVDWCIRTGNAHFLRSGGIWRLTVRNPLIYTIDSRLAFELIRADRPHDRRPPGLPRGYWTEPSIDFEALTEVYDAVELTPQGLDATRYEYVSMQCWDVPTIYWLRWGEMSVERVRTAHPRR